MSERPMVLITGASGGIGAALAREMAAQGHPVGVLARRAEALEAVVATIRDAGGRASAAVADVGERDALLAAVAALEAELGPCGVLVMNAALGLSTPMTEPDAEAFEAMLRVNLLGAYHAVEAVLPGMRARGRGHLVGISSLAAFVTAPGSGGYSATKAGLTSWMESLRMELRPHGIVCTTVHPGFVRTPMTAANTCPMPLLMEPEAAARRIARGIRRRKTHVDFPRRIAWGVGLIRRLPGPLRRRILSSGSEAR